MTTTATSGDGNGTAPPGVNGSPAPVAQGESGKSTPEAGRHPRTGQFRPGFSGNPRGSPVHRRIAGLKRAILDVVTEEEVRDLFKRLLGWARHGNMEAVRVILSYSIGRPAVHDPAGTEGEEDS